MNKRNDDQMLIKYKLVDGDNWRVLTGEMITDTDNTECIQRMIDRFKKDYCDEGWHLVEDSIEGSFKIENQLKTCVLTINTEWTGKLG